MIRIISAIVFFITTLVFAGLYFKDKSRIKIAFVDTIYLYENANVRKHYQAVLDDKKKQSKWTLDSLYAIAQKQNSEASVYAFGKKKEEVDASLVKLEKDLDARIWNQITEFTLAYGEEKGYDFIMGANGQGSLMYARKNANISADVLHYINDKFSDE